MSVICPATYRGPIAALSFPKSGATVIREGK
jgi:hypothetical protein